MIQVNSNVYEIDEETSINITNNNRSVRIDRD